MKKSISEFQNDIKKNENIYKKYLGNKYFDFNFIVNNIVNSINSYSSVDPNSYDSNYNKMEEYREISMYNNFKTLYEYLPKNRYFGQLGQEHVYQKEVNSQNKIYNNFAIYLNNKSSPVKGKVLSVAYVYKNCYYMSQEQPYSMKKLQYQIDGKDDKFISKYAESDVTVFKLDSGWYSPFNKKLIFSKNTKIKGVTTDYFKYILLIKNSKGASIYNSDK